jgi:hypothetical protein
MEIEKTKEKIPEEERGQPRGWVERPVKGCSPPNAVARGPPDDDVSSIIIWPGILGCSAASSDGV